MFIESFSKLVNLSTNYVNKAVVTLKSENKISKNSNGIRNVFGARIVPVVPDFHL